MKICKHLIFGHYCSFWICNIFVLYTYICNIYVYFVQLLFFCFRPHFEDYWDINPFIMLMKMTSGAMRMILQNIWRRVVGNVLINISPSKIFQASLSFERFIQNCQAAVCHTECWWVNLLVLQLFCGIISVVIYIWVLVYIEGICLLVGRVTWTK